MYDNNINLTIDNFSTVQTNVQYIEVQEPHFESKEHNSNL